MAARLEPRLEGLAPFMRALGYVFDDAVERWILYDDFMTARGFVEVEGRWIPRQEAEARARERVAAAEARRARERSEHLSRALELMVVAQLARFDESRRLERAPPAAYAGIPAVGGYPVGILPAFWPVGRVAPHPGATGSPAVEHGARSAFRKALLSRPPGSLISLPEPENHRGRLASPVRPR
jgi:hypothetical protein